MLFASQVHPTSLPGDSRTPYARNSPSPAVPPAPTIPSHPQLHLHPRATPSPTCCTPNQVIIELSTTVVIQDYQRYYSTDINSFSPSYFATDDGSLITPPLTDDLWSANLDLLLTAALAMLFLRNIAVAIDYLRRGKNKNKTLLYLLFISQALAPASFVPTLLAFFNQYLSCTLVVTFSSTVGSLALGILLSGIIGIKTYKCMNDSKIVAGVIAVLAMGHLAFVILDAKDMRGTRRIAGSCLRTSDLRYTRIAIALQMGACCFMMLCFVYTCIKYRKTPGARGRISLRMSMEELPLDIPGDVAKRTLEAGQEIEENSDLAEKSGNYLPPRASMLRISSELPITHPEDHRSHAHKSMASSFSRLSKLLANMVNLKKVMRDELLYTCVITVVITFALVFTFTGVNVKNGLSVTCWISLTWALVSVFVLHSSGRVVRRQERDSLVRYAAARNSRNALSTAKFTRTNGFWASPQSPDLRNRRDTRGTQNTDFGNPFSEKSRFREDRRPSGHSALTSSTGSSPLGPVMAIPTHTESVVLPSSPCESTYPTSGRATPVGVPEDSQGNLGSFSDIYTHETASPFSTSSQKIS